FAYLSVNTRTGPDCQRPGSVQLGHWRAREKPCMTATVDPQLPLRQFVKSHYFFIGIDSDGCVFDTMEVKHKECFIPNIIKFYHLAAISKYVREVFEFLNLYSKWRGTNRFPGLV